MALLTLKCFMLLLIGCLSLGRDTHDNGFATHGNGKGLSLSLKDGLPNDLLGEFSRPRSACACPFLKIILLLQTPVQEVIAS